MRTFLLLIVLALSASGCKTLLPQKSDMPTPSPEATLETTGRARSVEALQAAIEQQSPGWCEELSQITRGGTLRWEFRVWELEE